MIAMDDDSSDKEAPYQIGYGKPPEHSRFKPGQSGNPKGKRNGQKGYRSIVRDVLNEKVTVRTARGSKKMTKLEALVQTNVNKGLNGDAKSADLVLKIAREVGLTDDVADAIETARMDNLAEEDKAILERHFRRKERDKKLGDESFEVPGDDR